MPAEVGIDWGAVIGSSSVSLGLGGLALKLAFDMIREKSERIKAMEEGFRTKLESIYGQHEARVKELHDAHQRDAKEWADQNRVQREEMQRLLERVLEKIGELAVYRAGAAGGRHGGGGPAPEPGNGGGR